MHVCVRKGLDKSSCSACSLKGRFFRPRLCALAVLPPACCLCVCCVCSSSSSAVCLTPVRCTQIWSRCGLRCTAFLRSRGSGVCSQFSSQRYGSHQATLLASTAIWRAHRHSRRAATEHARRGDSSAGKIATRLGPRAAHSDRSNLTLASRPVTCTTGDVRTATPTTHEARRGQAAQRTKLRRNFCRSL